MEIKNFILATLTTSPTKEIKSQSFFRCESVEEMMELADRLEGILDGMAHKLSDEIMIIVKH